MLAFLVDGLALSMLESLASLSIALTCLLAFRSRLSSVSKPCGVRSKASRVSFRRKGLRIPNPSDSDRERTSCLSFLGLRSWLELSVSYKKGALVASVECIEERNPLSFVKYPSSYLGG
ncbi:unnamed protein product [Sphenostylis stenocarpa]|uniref:Uncharacterized protein n=1 Tax=Sphenostylis stenocarpa TaxID=92480 RepID=A0AA86VPD2_9FABA|nr:unnamed protein product [Sphenostylis stenocarpa]